MLPEIPSGCILPVTWLHAEPKPLRPGYIVRKVAGKTHPCCPLTLKFRPCYFNPYTKTCSCLYGIFVVYGPALTRRALPVVAAADSSNVLVIVCHRQVVLLSDDCTHQSCLNGISTV